MEVEIISTEVIKPCSPTPSHLKTYNISLLDQFVPPLFYSTVFFYHNTNPNLISQRSLVLKSSLSKTLSHFYPLAGRIKDHLSIDCNDQGAYYAQARANIPLDEYLTKPNLTIVKKLVPDVTAFNMDPTGAFLVMIQETTFSCGGLAIGPSVSHMVLDGVAFASFIKAWALTASSSGKDVTYPNLGSPHEFPQCKDAPKGTFITTPLIHFARKQKVAARRLVFDALAIDRLKSEAASTGLENPSRVEVVSAVITKSLMDASNANSIAMTHGVNIRRKANPPIPASSLGNFLWIAVAICTKKESQIRSFVYKLRQAVRKIDNQFLIKVKEEGFSKLYERVKQIDSELSDDGMEGISISSWCNFGLYKNSNFGWGNPIWITNRITADSEEKIPIINTCILNDSRSGNGVEALLNLPPSVLASMEKNHELLQYATFDSSLLSISTDTC